MSLTPYFFHWLPCTVNLQRVVAKTKEDVMEDDEWPKQTKDRRTRK